MKALRLSIRLTRMKKLVLHLFFFGNIFFVNAQNTEYMMSSEYINAVRQEFYILVNAHRRANRLRELEVNTDLEKYADIRAMEQRKRFGHTRPNGSAAGSGWYNSQNNMNTRWAENAISVHRLNPNPAATASNIFNTWKNSPGHNRHMLFNFSPHINMAFGIFPELSNDGLSVTSGAIFATGYGGEKYETELRAILERSEAEVRAAYPEGNLPDDYFELIGATEYRIKRGREIPPDVVVIPATYKGLPVTEISVRTGSSRNSAFGSRDNILVVYIPESVKYINFASFWYCTNLAKIVIPRSIISIASNAFTGCTDLSSIAFVGSINPGNISANSFPGDLQSKYLAGGSGIYTRPRGSNAWTQQ